MTYTDSWLGFLDAFWLDNNLPFKNFATARINLTPFRTSEHTSIPLNMREVIAPVCIFSPILNLLRLANIKFILHKRLPFFRFLYPFPYVLKINFSFPFQLKGKNSTPSIKAKVPGRYWSDRKRWKRFLGQMTVHGKVIYDTFWIGLEAFFYFIVTMTSKTFLSHLNFTLSSLNGFYPAS